eukprot:8499964-Pyramimonas_sp.AAC.1
MRRGRRSRERRRRRMRRSRRMRRTGRKNRVDHTCVADAAKHAVHPPVPSPLSRPYKSFCSLLEAPPWKEQHS